MLNIQIDGRFKIYDDLVVISKEVWQLSTFNRGSKRTKPMRKLKYYKDRNAYGYNRSYISKDKLLKLHYESSEMYKRMAAEAEAEGHEDIAVAFDLVARVEEAHEARYRKLLANIENEKVFKRNEEARWKCGNCGYIFSGREAPPRCPACRKTQAFFELFCEAY